MRSAFFRVILVKETVLSLATYIEPWTYVKSAFRFAGYYSQRTGAPFRPGRGSASVGESSTSDVSLGEVGDSGSVVIVNEAEKQIRCGVGVVSVDYKLNAAQYNARGKWACVDQ